MNHNFELLVNTCIGNKITISTCESITAGMFASQIADIPNASKVLALGLVTYQTAAKKQILGIGDIVEQFGVISQACANAMAIKTFEKMKSDIVIAFTGNAGPDVQDNKSVGLVYMAIYFKMKVYEYELRLTGERNDIRAQICNIGCQKILSVLEGEEYGGEE